MKQIVVSILLCSLSVTVQAEHHQSSHAHKPPGVTELSADIRALLSQEMLAIEKAMQQIVSANAAGDWQTIHQLGLKIKNSFILKQKLSDKQKHQLHTLLPESFLEQDRQFHYYAGMLAHVAEKQKAELVNFYFGKMNEACASCHANHATHKFPGFVSNKTDRKEEHQH